MLVDLASAWAATRATLQRRDGAAPAQLEAHPTALPPAEPAPGPGVARSAIRDLYRVEGPAAVLVAFGRYLEAKRTSGRGRGWALSALRRVFEAVSGATPPALEGAPGAPGGPGRQVARPLPVVERPTVMTTDTIGVQYGLDHLVIAETSDSPLGRPEFLRSNPHRHTFDHFRRYRTAISVAANTALHFARHHVGKTPHPLNRPSLGIKRHKVDWHLGGNVEGGAAVGFDVGKAPKSLGSIRRTARH